MVSHNHTSQDMLQAEHIFSHYGEHRVLQDVSVALAPGEHVAVIGPSGSGKTTLLKTLMRLVEPAAGKILLNGTTPGRDYFQHVQLIAQDPMASLDPRLPIREILCRPQRRLGVSGDPLQRAREALDRVHVPETVLDRTRHEISGGQAQRIAIARALAIGAHYLLCDEPITGLDPPLRADLLRYLATLEDVGILFVSHDLAACEFLCTRGYVIAGGQVEAEGPLEAIVTSQVSPTAAALKAAQPKLP